MRECTRRLVSSGFVGISERQPFGLAQGGKYFFTRNQSTLVAFAVGKAFMPGNAFKIVGAHTDSPVLKLKPKPLREGNGYLQCGVEVYGGGLWHTWLDRDLGLAGRVVVKNGDGFLSRLVHINRPILRVPSLCVHLQTSDERAALKLNAEDQLVPLLGLSETSKDASGAAAAATESRLPSPLLQLLARELGVEPSAIVDFDLTLCDTQPAQIGGINNELLFGPRLDNQMHCFTSVAALIEYASSVDVETDADVSMVVLFDHEEVGSESVGGACSPIVRDAVERISQAFQLNPGSEMYKIALDKSLLVSADGAHALHPNYVGKHESKHQPKMNAGTVIKTNSNQRYATSGTTGFLVREIARRAGVPVQEFVIRQDSPCGTTIGPIVAANTGIRTVDVGIPQLSMHSIRETCGVKDLESNAKLLRAFFSIGRAVDESLREMDDDHDVA